MGKMTSVTTVKCSGTCAQKEKNCDPNWRKLLRGARRKLRINRRNGMPKTITITDFRK